jgi:adenosylcobinamide-GDP ribazoletransferase
MVLKPGAGAIMLADDRDEGDSDAGGFRPLAELLLALRFQTRLPIPFLRTLDPPPLARAMRFFPLAGAVVGALTGLMLVGAALLRLPPLLAAIVAVAGGMLLTGSRNEDGLADTADGFGGGETREQRLDIMTDSRLGTYGTAALVLSLMGRAALYQQLLMLRPPDTVLLLAGVAAFSRALAVDLLWATRPARTEMVMVYPDRPSRAVTLFALFTGGAMVLAAGAVFIAPEAGMMALVAALATTAGLRALSMRLIGGQTDDVVGAAQVLSEIAMLAALAASIG